jgi:hypothetical protein
MAEKQKETPKEPIEQRLAKKVSTINETNSRIADEMLQAGSSERELAAFTHMHESINYLADAATKIGGQDNRESFLVALQTALFEMAKRLGGGDENSRGRENVARNPDVLKDKLVAAIEEIQGMNDKV